MPSYLDPNDLYTVPEDTGTSLLNPTLLAQAEALARRKQALQARALDAARGLGLSAAPQAPAQNTSFKSAVTGAEMIGTQPRINPLAALTPVLAGYGDSRAEKLYAEEASGYSRMEQVAVQKHMGSKPPDDAPVQEKLQWAQRGADIPALKNLMTSYADEELNKMPIKRAELDAKLAEARRAQANADRTAAEINRHNLASEGKQNLDFVADQYGNVRAFDKHSGKEVSLQPTTPIPKGGPSSTGGPPTTGPGKPSGKVEGQIADAQEKVSKIDSVLQVLGDAEPHLAKVNPGLKGTITDLWESELGTKSTTSTQARKSLKLMAENLKPLYPRPPGDPTGQEVENWSKAMADLGNPMLNPEDTRAAITTLKKILADQRARLTGQPAAAPAAPSGNVSGEPTVREAVTNGVTADRKVSPETQRARDRDRVAILTDELAKARTAFDNAPNPEAKARAKSDIDSIEKEIRSATGNKASGNKKYNPATGKLE